MPIRFNPSGNLDVGTDPSDLPSQAQGKVVISGAMTRCTNLNLDRTGIASTRRGNAKLNATALDETDLYKLLEYGGHRYEFAGTKIYQDELEIQADLTSAPWSVIVYNSYNSAEQSIFGFNGTDRKRLTGTDLQEWGSESPTVAPIITVGSSPGLTGAFNVKYTWARKEEDVVVWESNPSPAADDAVTLTDQSLEVTFTYPVDEQITHVRIYRTLAGGYIYLHDKDVELDWVNHGEEYDYAYCFDWEPLSMPDEIGYYSWIYCYEWEEEFVGGYKAFTDDLVHHGIVCFSWELSANYDGIDPALVTANPWEYSEYFPAFTGNFYQAFTYYGIYVAMFTWEIGDEYTGTDTEVICSNPWEAEYLVVTITVDNDLGTEAYWNNHDRPPLGSLIIGPNFSGTCFIFLENKLYYCLPSQPEYWPSDYYIELSTKEYPLISGAFLDGVLYIATSVEIYQISGSGAGTFFPSAMSAQTGTVNENCFVAVKGQGIYHLGLDGIYLYSGGKDQLVSRGNLDKVFSGDGAGSIPGLNRTYIDNCWMVSYHGKLYIAYPGGESEYPDNLLIYDLQTQKLVHHDYGVSWRVVAVDNTMQRLLAGGTDGIIWKWESIDCADDAGVPIAWEIQSAEFNQLRKYFPRYVRYDVKVGTGGMANGYILLDDTSKQTHPLNGDRLTRKRLVDGCTGDRLAVRISGTGAVDIYGVEVE